MADRKRDLKRHLLVRNRKAWGKRRMLQTSCPEPSPATTREDTNPPPDIGLGPRPPFPPLEEADGTILDTTLQPPRTSPLDAGDENCAVQAFQRYDDEDHDIHTMYLGEERNNPLPNITLNQNHPRDHPQSQMDYLNRKKLANIMLQDHVLSGLCQIVGKYRLTAKQYRRSRMFLNFEGGHGRREGFPSYSAIYSTILPLMRVYVYTPTMKITLDVDSRRAGAAQPEANAAGDLVAARKEIKLILPSSWAGKDVSTIAAFSSTIGTLSVHRLHCPTLCHQEIERTPLLQEPATHLRANTLQSMACYGGSFISDSRIHDGDGLQITLQTSEETTREILLSLGANFERQNRRSTMLLNGTLIGSSLQENDDRGVLHGDVVSSVHVSATSSKSEMLIFLVHRMKRTPLQPSQVLVIRAVDRSQDDISIRCLRVCKSHTSTNFIDCAPPHPYAHGYGKLADGRLYSVYRVMLYSDDFQQFTRKKGSAGGCYLLPLNIPLNQRRGRSSVRVLSLTPPGVSSNKAIMSIIPDIITGTTTGIETVDFFGVKRSVFIEVVAYIGDYVAVQHTQDLNGPKGIAPCPLCTFPKGSEVESTTSEYAYSVTAHSGHASFRRDKKRMRILRQACVNVDELKLLGLRHLNSEEYSQLLLHALSDALDEVRPDVPKTEHGDPVVAAYFDPYLSSIVAPDHLLSGLAEDVINTNMRLLPKRKLVIAESLIQHALSRSGLKSEPHLYDHDNLHLHSMSISTMFNLILISPWAISLSRSYKPEGEADYQGTLDITPQLDLLFQFQVLVSDTLFFPQCDIDGKHAVDDYNKSEGNERLIDLKKKCTHYIQSVDEVCANNELAKKELDKPNIHRLLELYNHTIPLLGHIRQGQELMFESAHQPLKKALKQSNNIDSQLTAIDEMLANDWKSRLSSALHEYGVQDASQLSDEQCMKLKQILCGGQEGVPSTEKTEEDTVSSIRSCFNEAVITDFLQLHQDDQAAPTRHWRPAQNKKHKLSDIREITDTSGALSYISALHQAHVNAGGSVFPVMYAKGIPKDRNPRKHFFERVPKRSVHIIGRGDIVQAAVRDFEGHLVSSSGAAQMLYTQEDTTDCSTSPSCTRRFWIVLDIVAMAARTISSSQNNEDTRMFAIVWPVNSHPVTGTIRHPLCKYYKAYHVTEKDTLYVLPLRGSVIKAMALHFCNWKESTNCRITPHTGNCVHHGSINDGEPFFLFGSMEGFPPRKG